MARTNFTLGAAPQVGYHVSSLHEQLTMGKERLSTIGQVASAVVHRKNCTSRRGACAYSVHALMKVRHIEQVAFDLHQASL